MRRTPAHASRLLALLALTLACAVITPAALASADPHGDCAGIDATSSASNLAALRTSVICLTNRERLARGMPALNEEAHLDAAAQGHSEDMAENNYFDHIDLKGGKPWDRTKAAGYPSGWIGENIAAGYGTPLAVMTGWMKSEGHCENILTTYYIDIGIGVIKDPSSQYGTYWTMVLGGNNSSAPKVTVTCPYTGLVDGSFTVPDTSTGNAAPVTTPKITSVKKRAHGRYRVTGTAASGAKIKLTVKRGKKSRKYTVKASSKGSFTKTVKAPGGHGKVRVTAKA